MPLHSFSGLLREREGAGVLPFRRGLARETAKGRETRRDFLARRGHEPSYKCDDFYGPDKRKRAP